MADTYEDLRPDTGKLAAYPAAPADLPVSTAAQTALDGKVDENAAIAAGTIPVSYDVKGLVTGGHASLAWDATNNNLLLGGAAASAQATLAILGTKTIAVPAAGSAWNALDFQASTLTLAAGGAAPNELAAVRFAAPVITAGAGSAYVVPVAATMIIDGPPVAGAGGGATPTLTSPLSLFIKTGPVAIGDGSFLTGWVGANTAAAIFAPTKFLYVDSNVGGEWGLKFRGIDNEGRAWEDIFQFTGNGTTGEIKCGPAKVSYFLTLYGGAAEAARITKTQNLLIGTTTDAAASRLNVVATKFVASAAGAVWDGVKFAASTLILTGTVTPVTALSLFTIEAPTITSASAITVAKAATMTIAGPPAQAGSTTITAAASLKVLAGSLVCQGAALATDATDGFLYIPTCAGTPTGVPTAQTGTVPLVFDTTNHKLYGYDGSWLDLT